DSFSPSEVNPHRAHGEPAPHVRAGGLAAPPRASSVARTMASTRAQGEGTWPSSDAVELSKAQRRARITNAVPGHREGRVRSTRGREHGLGRPAAIVPGQLPDGVPGGGPCPGGGGA